MSNIGELNEILKNAQKASVIARALHYSWVELQGHEVALMLEMTTEYTDFVTEHLINLSGEDGEAIDA
ncbi:hypothetical protein K9I53_02195 [Klebsiella quasipneumoniae]|jgi:penicillin-binding protein-related factor A (putative recombinase)|uniref:hypothetical protein n=1 Tax=Klebsiella TaxID=570 RepID=UPI000E2BD93E|nr:MULTISPECIES: hypothetical protein [Klebsiella]MDU1520324.1 hypothetical protein [Klebsiella michiganensis]DAQ65659.1 MAG TPA: hypothetical protein [Caudoviricetes sp.]MBD7349801.1 hypothetical protein [Klebsiella pneumoniae]MBE0214005.1 hypothetical protein [Klebsiella pneumoniae]MCQ0776145.1 hypothetical protein [Klebsiella pneumoniae]